MSSGIRQQTPSYLPQALLVAAAFARFETVHHVLFLRETLIVDNLGDDDISNREANLRCFSCNEVDNIGWTSLMYMIAWGNLELVKSLLRHGADPCIGTSSQGYRDVEYWDPLLLASHIGREDIRGVLDSWLSSMEAIRND